MWRRFKLPLFNNTITERVVLSVMWLFIVTASRIGTFETMTFLWAAVGACVFMNLSSRTRSGLITGAMATLVIAGIAAAETRKVMQGHPYWNTVSGTKFQNTPLPEALQFFAQQRNEWPRWRFTINDPTLAATKITVDLPDRCRFEDAMTAIGAAARCEFKLRWWRDCGNAMDPGCAWMLVYPQGARPDKWPGNGVLISEHSISYPRARQADVSAATTNLPPTTFRADR